MIITYQKKNSLIHSLDPRAKILFVIMTVIAILIESSMYAYGYLALIIILPFFFTGIQPIKIIRGIAPFLILFFLTFIFHFLLTPGRIIFDSGIFKGTYEGLVNGGIFSTRLLLIILTSMLLGFTTSPIDFADSLSGLFSRFKSKTIREIPVIIIFVLRFIPYMIKEGKRILTAQRARGASVGLNREIFTILFPIINSSIKRADSLALALHARAYEPGESRTSLKDFEFGIPEYIFLIYSLIPILTVILF